MNGAKFQRLDEGRIQVATRWRPLLEANGLTTLDAVMALEGEVMRAVPGRSTSRVHLQQPGGAEWVGFLKCYTPEYLRGARGWLRRMGWPDAQDEAEVEWRALGRLRAEGFSTAEPVALGRERQRGVITRSFLLTAEIAQGVAAHDYARGLTAGARRRLAAQIGKLAARFHQAGFVHRDFYLSHLFVVPQDERALEPVIIDLQRLFRPRLFQRRWQVKDLAQLGYSARLAGAQRADLLQFYFHYTGRKRLTRDDKQRWHWIARRIRSLEGRRPKYDVIWDQPGVHPPNV